MTVRKLSPLVIALAAALPQLASAQSAPDVAKELAALKARIAQLEEQVKNGQGMTPDQQAEFNRVTVKAEALEDARDMSGMKLMKINGYMDPAFIWNKRQDRAGFQFLNKVEDDGYNYDNSYFGTVSLDFQKETDSGTKWRLTLSPNRGVGSVFDGNSIVHEATVSIPLGDLQTRLIAGQMPDWSGYEYLQPTLNKLITHNLLFDFTLPTAYTGAGMEITRGKWITKAMLANMNASKKQPGNKAPVVTYRVDYAKGEFQGFGFAGVHGKAANFTENVVDGVTGEVIGQKDSRLDLFEFDAYFIRGDWTLQGQISVGQQKDASITPDPVTGALRKAQWWGVSALAAHKFDPRLEGIVRVDYLNNTKNGGGLLGYTASDDRNGIGPGWSDDGAGGWTQADPDKGVKRMALSLGMGWVMNMNTVVKAELRIDRANAPVFIDAKSGSYSKTNQLLGTAVVVSF